MDTAVATPSVQRFPPNTYAIMVHKLYADRVVDFLLDTARDDPSMGRNRRVWTRAYSSSSSNNNEGDGGDPASLSPTNQHSRQPQVMMIRPTLATRFAAAAANSNNDDSIVTEATALATWTVATGVSHKRRGYFLVLVPATLQSFTKMSPMARANIAWMGRITHSCRLAAIKQQQDHSDSMQQQQQQDERKEESSSIPAVPYVLLHQLGNLLWDTCQAQGISITDHNLKVECHPREMVETVCLALQTSCAKALGLPNAPTEAFEGPITMTMSRTKCTHRLTIAIIETNNETTTVCTDYYWGLDDQPGRLLEVNLNQEASKEILIVPCNHKTGEEASNSKSTNSKRKQQKIRKIDPTTAPLSRAYYKLEQVVTDMLMPLVLQQGGTTTSFIQHLQRHGAALDIGAAPGGWTQILAQLLRVKVVVAVDPAILASRVTQLSNVRHLAASLETADYSLVNRSNDDNKAVNATMAYSMLVCDASILWYKLLKQLSDHVLQKATWTFPCVFVVTLKLPFKTPNSLERQVHLIYKEIPDQLMRMADVMFPPDGDNNKSKVTTFFRIAHLMANSDSERTLIAIFDDKDGGPAATTTTSAGLAHA